jgi:hypothetical protein
MIAAPIERNRAAFAELFTAIAALYRQELSRVQLELYWRALGGQEIETLQEAATRHLADAERGRFMPLPADFAAAIHGTRPQRAAAMLLRVRRVAKHVGGYRSVVIDDATTAATLRQLGGWEKAVQAIAHDPAEFDRRFTATFCALADNPAACLERGPQILEGGDARIARESGKPLPLPVGAHQLAEQPHAGGALTFAAEGAA